MPRLPFSLSRMIVSASLVAAGCATSGTSGQAPPPQPADAAVAYRQVTTGDAIRTASQAILMEPARVGEAAPDLPTASPSEAEAPAAPRLRTSLDRLMGLSEFETLAILGDPNLQREQAPARIWVYVSGDCALNLYFYPDVAAEMYRALAYRVITLSDQQRSHEECVDDFMIVLAEREHDRDRPDSRSNRARRR